MSFGAHHKILNEDRPVRPILSSAVMYTNNYSFWFMRTFVEVPWGGGVKRQWGCWQRQFSAFAQKVCVQQWDRCLSPQKVF